MDDYRNNFKVEKAIKSALYRDRARIQVGRISMFGLLELSRQRLRSSLIDKTFDKCNFCNGSGLILNANAISDQIIKVINEKISNSQNINVKCNTSLAETLINNKNKEISDLEKKYESKIKFNFDSQFSLHEPLVEIENQKNIIIEHNEGKKIKTKKKIIRKKTKINKKTEEIKTIESKNKSVGKKKIKIIKDKIKVIKAKKISKKEGVEKKELENENKNTDEKTGWWS